MTIPSEHRCQVRAAAFKLRGMGFSPLKITASGRGAGVPIVAGMASIPSRKNLLRKIVEKMLPQVDHMFICLNNYGYVPGFLNREKITIVRSEDAGDIRDNAKFLSLFLIQGSFYFLGLDDDLDYPEAYASRLIERVEAYDRRAVIGVHGAIYPASASSFRNRLVLHYSRGLRHDVPVSVLGTGTVAAFGPLLRDCVSSFTQAGMADLLVASAAKSALIPLVAVARDAGWLQSFNENKDEESLYVNTMRNSTAHDKAVNENRPWGFGRIKTALNHAHPDGHRDLAAALSLITFGGKIEEGDSPLSITVPWHPGVFDIAAEMNFPELLIAGIRSVVQIDAEGTNSDDLFRIVTLWPPAARLDMAKKLIEGGEYQIAQLMGDALLRNSSLTEGLGIQLRSLIASGAVKEAKDLYLNECRGINSALDGVVELAIAEAFSAEDLGPPVWAAARTGARGTSALALYAARTAQPWAEDAALSAIRRGLKGGWEREYFENLRGLPGIVKRPDRWLDLARTLPPDRRPQIASVVLAAELWPAAASIQDFITSLPAREQMFWVAETKRQLGMDDAFSAINLDLIDHGLTPIMVRGSSDQPALGRLQPTITPPSWFPESIDLPRVSIIVAYYNDSNTIEYALNSISQQSYPNIEVIVIDDCSAVPLQIPAGLIPERMKPVLHRHDVNGGPYACRNTGLTYATGDLICTHDSDDWMHPEHIEKQVLKLLSSQDAKAVYSHHVRVTSHGALAFENHGMFIGDGPMTGMFYRHVFDDIGVFVPARTRGDMEFKARLQAAYGKGSIAYESSLTLVSLAWQSNSKRSISDWQKLKTLAGFKRDYRSKHRYMRFLADPEDRIGRQYTEHPA